MDTAPARATRGCCSLASEATARSQTSKNKGSRGQESSHLSSAKSRGRCFSLVEECSLSSLPGWVQEGSITSISSVPCPPGYCAPPQGTSMGAGRGCTCSTVYLLLSSFSLGVSQGSCVLEAQPWLGATSWEVRLGMVMLRGALSSRITHMLSSFLGAPCEGTAKLSCPHGCKHSPHLLF